MFHVKIINRSVCLCMCKDPKSERFVLVEQNKKKVMMHGHAHGEEGVGWRRRWRLMSNLCFTIGYISIMWIVTAPPVPLKGFVHTDK